MDPEAAAHSIVLEEDASGGEAEMEMHRGGHRSGGAQRGEQIGEQRSGLQHAGTAGYSAAEHSTEPTGMLARGVRARAGPSSPESTSSGKHRIAQPMLTRPIRAASHGDAAPSRRAGRWHSEDSESEALRESPSDGGLGVEKKIELGEVGWEGQVGAAVGTLGTSGGVGGVTSAIRSGANLARRAAGWCGHGSGHGTGMLHGQGRGRGRGLVSRGRSV